MKGIEILAISIMIGKLEGNERSSDLKRKVKTAKEAFKYIVSEDETKE